jgi:hypothetical protein
MNYTDIVEWYNKHKEIIHKRMKYDWNLIKQKYSSKDWFPLFKFILAIKSIQRAYRNPSVLSKYFIKIYPMIKKLLKSCDKPFKYIPSPLDPNTPEFLEQLKNSYKIRCRQMKQGEIMQIIIGNFPGWTDLGIGHKTGLDCIKEDNSCIMELKNRYNTVNSGGTKFLCDKLAEYKTHNPETRCIWGIVIPKNEKNLKTEFYHNGYRIEKLQGNELFKLVFTKDNIYYGDKILAFTRFLLNI